MRTDRANAGYREEKIAALRARDGDDCWFCGDPIHFRDSTSQKRCTIEHLIPVAYGGPRWADWNLVLAHHRCNGLAADHRLQVKFSFRDLLRENGGWRAMETAGGGRHLLKLAGAPAVVVLRRDRTRARRQRRDLRRWLARVPGHPGWALKRFGSVMDVARISFQ